MKINRRSFLALGAGTTAGVALSPLPWKITDDIAIWTQNWPWTPVPKDGKYDYIDSFCSLCPAKCKIKVRTVDKRPIKIEGAEDDNFPNKKGVCLLGLSSLQYLYHNEKRIKSPLKRVNDTWQEISWDEAISYLADSFDKIGKDANQNQVYCISASKNDDVESIIFKKFLDKYGSHNYLCPQNIEDSYENILSPQKDLSYGFDFENSDFIISFGAGIFEGWGQPVRLFKLANQIKEKKLTLAQVEPRCSNTASIATDWLAIKPGTEKALALGICNIIITESRQNRSYINQYVDNYYDWEKIILEKYTPSYVSEVTGLNKSDIISLAQGFSRAKSPIAIFGRGKGDNPISYDEALSFHMLNVLTGNINKKGGFFVKEKYEYSPKLNDKFKKNQNSSLESFFTKIVKDEIKCSALILNKANPIYSLSNYNDVKGAFDKIELIISTSSFMDESAQLADIILPDDMYLEKYQDAVLENGFKESYLLFSKPVIKPLFNTKNTSDLIIQLANKMGIDIGWSSYEDAIQNILFQRYTSLEKDMIETLTRRTVRNNINLDNDYLEFCQKDENNKDEICLVTYDSMRITKNILANSPFMTKSISDEILKKNDLFVEINPKTAKKYSLKEGSSIKITTKNFDATVRVHIFDGAHPDAVFIPTGLGHQIANAPYISDKGINAKRFFEVIEDKNSNLNVAYKEEVKINKI